MTISPTQRGGRLQEEGCLEYGKDDSWSTTGSIYERPLACQEVSHHNQRGCVSLRYSLVQPERLCWRKNVGRKNYKTKNAEGISSYLCYHNKNNCFLDCILDARKKEFQIQQGRRKY